MQHRRYTASHPLRTSPNEGSQDDDNDEDNHRRQPLSARSSESSPALTPIPGEALVRINLLNATIGRGSDVTPLRGRDLELAYCIALRERPVSRPTLTADIWPSIDDDEARNMFCVALHRLRKRLGRRDAVCLTPHGYALGPQVTTDLQALEIFGRTLVGRRLLSDRETDLARAAHRRLGLASAPTQIAATETGGMFERRINDLKHQFAHHLAVGSLVSNQAAKALDIAREMIQLDGCDESAWEIAIRAHLAHNDRGAAIRDYRTYVRNLDHELGLPPSRVIRKLIAQYASDSDVTNS